MLLPFGVGGARPWSHFFKAKKKNKTQETNGVGLSFGFKTEFGLGAGACQGGVCFFLGGGVGWGLFLHSHCTANRELRVQG